AHRARRKRCEIGAGVGLGETLSPKQFATQDRGQQPRLQLRTGVGIDDRPKHTQTRVIRCRRAGQRAFLLEHKLAQMRPACAAVLDGPVGRAPAALEQNTLPAALILTHGMKTGTTATSYIGW